MEEQARMSCRTSRRIVIPIVLVFGLLIIAGGAVSYAAVNGWLPWAFSIDAEGTVTDESGEVVGETHENEDGTATTIIRVGEDYEYRVHTEQPLSGRRLMIQPAQADQPDPRASTP